MKLTERIDDTFLFKGVTCTVNMAFDNILLLFEMFDDDNIPEYEKPLLGLEMLIVNYHDGLAFDSIEEALEMFKYIMSEFVNAKKDKQKQPQPEEDAEESVITFDFTKDAELIFASFFAVYKIDLFEQQGKLHWHKFCALMNNLGDEAPLSKAIGYRTMKIPAADQYNAEQVAHLRKMKEYYSLDERTPEQKINNAFDTLSHALKGG